MSIYRFMRFSLVSHNLPIVIAIIINIYNKDLHMYIISSLGGIFS